MNPVLMIDNLVVEMSSARLLDAVSLRLDRGALCAVVGPNGAGKSTLLKALAGDIRSSQGGMHFAGHNLSHWVGPARAARLAVLPQFSVLNFPFAVEEVVALGRLPHSSGRQRDKQIVAAVMRAMDIEYLRGRDYTRLSGGEKQRTQLARVLAQIWAEQDAGPRLLLLDEPTAALDLGHQQQLMSTLKEKCAEGLTIVMVVHDVNIAARHADWVLALACGRIRASGLAETVIREDILSEMFRARVRVLQDPQSHCKIVVL